MDQTTIGDVLQETRLDYDINAEEITVMKMDRLMAYKDENANTFKLYLSKGTANVDLSTSEVGAKMFFTTASGQLITINGVVSSDTIWHDTDFDLVWHVDFTLTNNCYVQGKFRADICLTKGTKQRTVIIMEGNIL